MKFFVKIYKLYLIVVAAFVVINVFSIFDAKFNAELLRYIIIYGLALILTQLPISRNCFTKYIISFYYVFLGIIQPIDIMNRVEAYTDSIRTSPALVLNQTLRLHYLDNLIISFVTIIAVVYFFYHSNKSFQFMLPSNIYTFRIHVNPIVLGIIYGVIKYIIQSKYKILVAGSSPIIPHSGIIVYSIRILNILLFGLSLDAIISSKMDVRKQFKTIFFLFIIYALPQTLLGTRSEIITWLTMTVFVIVNNYKFKDIKILFKYILPVAVLLGAALIVASYVRFSERIDIFAFLTGRFTGMVDGINIVKYLDDGGHWFPIKNFFYEMIGVEGGIRIASFYTHTIMGYPSHLLHSWAMPGFCAGLLYMGMFGNIFISIFVGYIFLKAENMIKSSKGIFDNCAGAYLYVASFFAFMEGSVDTLANNILVVIVVKLIIILSGLKFSIKKEKI